MEEFCKSGDQPGLDSSCSCKWHSSRPSILRVPLQILQLLGFRYQHSDLHNIEVLEGGSEQMVRQYSQRTSLGERMQMVSSRTWAAPIYSSSVHPLES
ncbi:hypothetical protein TNCT_24561 [Trichonephila clavata]|uniref:Uncharacterized protein n=1 Tax=Trichonephila clavata TaxID=2740835 RepID=A0A8X6JBK1_TRICU|nr:hypothetical protein TNCT_24561 [Trichonephila clavata]